MNFKRLSIDFSKLETMDYFQNEMRILFDFPNIYGEIHMP